MLARCATYVLHGVEARRVTVECDVRPGLPSFTVVGLTDAANRELRETVRAGILNSGYRFPECRVTVNVAPASLRQPSPAISLAVAAAVLAAAGEIAADQVADVVVYGALALSGDIRPLPGVLATAAEHRSSGCQGMLLYAGAPLPQDLAPIPSQPVFHLKEIPGGDRNRHVSAAPVSAAPQPDFAEIHGCEEAIFALTVAAAGGHHVLLRGGPGSGATMLARRLVSILPELTDGEQRQVATIRDAAGLGRERDRPFRAPHHTISTAGLVGGGSPVRPGEVTLAHHGVLYLDSLVDFPRSSLDALRAPLTDHGVSIVRGSRGYRFPARFQLVAAVSPCPCGYSKTDRCVCDAATLVRHRRRLAGSLLDHFAIFVDLPSAVDVAAAPPGPSSAQPRARVLAARERQAQRHAAPRECEVPAAPVTRRLPADLSAAAQAALERAYQTGSLSPRGRQQVLQVAQTIADLAGEASITATALQAALALRGNLAGAAPMLAC